MQYADRNYNQFIDLLAELINKYHVNIEKTKDKENQENKKDDEK